MEGAWGCLGRAVDKYGKTLDFMLLQRRNKPAATTFLARKLDTDDLP
ncbi:DDE-type integrase/transposase/recombinase [Ruegeria sp. 2012CJ15-1]